MGGDGGSIPKRHELSKTAKRPPQKDKDMDRNAKWSMCTISQQALTPPLMTCELGNLYSKESVLEYLLDNSISKSVSHIRSLKDVKELKLTTNIGYQKPLSELADQYYDTQASRYVCPVVGVEMNGKYKFCALWTCGCVLSERALKEVDVSNCHNCGLPFTKDDIIILKPEGVDIALMENNMLIRREKAKALRKKEKERKCEKRKQQKELDASLFKAPPALLSKLANPILNGKTDNSVDTTTGSSSKKVKLIKGVKKAKVDMKTPKEEVIDVKQSQVYKNLFTSGQKFKNRDKDTGGHWVTYNSYHL